METKQNEMKWNEMKWNEMKWNEMKWNEMKVNVLMLFNDNHDFEQIYISNVFYTFVNIFFISNKQKHFI